MNHLRNVWVFADRQASTDAALGVALDIAVRQQAALRLVAAVEGSDDSFLSTALGQEMLQLVRHDKTDRLTKLAERARALLPQDRVVTTLLETEVGWHSLVAQAVAQAPDLVIVPASGDAPGGPFGTVSHHLFRKCPTPVWSVQADTVARPKRILVAINPEVEGTDSWTLSGAVIDFALRLTAGTETELHVATAWSLLGEGLIRSKYGETQTAEFLESQRQLTVHCTGELLRESNRHPAVTALHYPKGEPGKAIPELADRLNADVVVLGSAARRGLAGFFISSAAETILGGLHCSAIVVKRPDFKSPVRAAA